MTNCKLITNIPCRFVITLSCNPAISLQSVRIDKIVYEHRHFRGNKKNPQRPNSPRGNNSK